MDKEFELHHHGQQDEDPSYVTSRNGQINNNTTGDGNSSKKKSLVGNGNGNGNGGDLNVLI